MCSWELSGPCVRPLLSQCSSAATQRSTQMSTLAGPVTCTVSRLDHGLQLTLNFALVPVHVFWYYLQSVVFALCNLLAAASRQLHLCSKVTTRSSSAVPQTAAQVQQPALPPPASPSRLTVVLDLDETLIASWSPAEVPSTLQHAEPPVHAYTMRLPFGPGVTDCTSSKPKAPQPAPRSHAPISQAPGRTQFNYTQVLVVQRPGLHDFLRRLSAFAELVLFTAAVPEYAEPIVRQVVDPDNTLFQGRVLYRQHTKLHRPLPGSSNQSLQCIKDLSNLGRDLSRVVLVDNNPYSFLFQPSNGVPCLPFRSDPTDRHLSAVLLPLLQSLALFQDVRPILDARFKLSQWFTQRGLVVPTQPAGIPLQAALRPIPAASAGGVIHKRLSAPVRGAGSHGHDDDTLSRESCTEGGSGIVTRCTSVSLYEASQRRMTHA